MSEITSELLSQSENARDGKIYTLETIDNKTI